MGRHTRFARKVARCVKLFLLFSLLVPFALALASTRYHNMPITGTKHLTQLDKKMINLMRRWHIPGGAVAIIRYGKLKFARGYGWANIHHHQKVYPNNLFRIGSISKTITAVTTLKLIQEHKLALNDHPYKILNTLKPLDGLPTNPHIYHITIRDLLDMSSGWVTSGPHSPDPMFGPWSLGMLKQIQGRTPPSCKTAAKMMMSMPMQYHPGTQFSYSNLNYCLLGLVISKVTANNYHYTTYTHYVKRNLLAPIGIHDMRIGNEIWEKRQPKEVTYYRYDRHHQHFHEKNPDGLPYSYHHLILHDNYSDGGWIASAIDLAKFFNALGRGNIINRHMINVMTARPYFQHHWEHYFASGIVIDRRNGHTYWIKTGSFTGTTAIAIYKRGDSAYAAVFNTEPAHKFTFLNQVQKLLIHMA